VKKYGKVLILCATLGSLFLAGQGELKRDFSVPVSKYVFEIEIDGINAGYFSSVEGLRIEQEVIEYQDANDPLIRKMPGRIKYGDIILRKGYVIGTLLNNWIEASRTGDGEDYRKTMSIILIDKTPPWYEGVEIKRWNCYGCFPRSWTLSGLDNLSRPAPSEEMVIAIEYFEETEPATYVP
jgi:phage tail-like protein